MEIIAFDNDSRLLGEFIDLGYRLYSRDTRFIPPQRSHLERCLSRKFHAFEKPGNEFLNFVARERGEVVGRISAFVNRDLRDHDGEPVGALGYFECIDDYTVAKKLLDSATRWLAEQHGLRRIRGPMNFDIWHGYRFMTVGFQEKPFVGEPHNMPYYPEYFARYGFSIKAEWDSLEVTGRETICSMIDRGGKRCKLLRERGYRFEHMHLSSIDDDLPRLHRVLCSSFKGFIGYTEIPTAEFALLFETFETAFDSDLSIIVYDEYGRLAGFAIACIELSEAVLAMGNKSSAWSRLKFARYRRRSRTANFYVGGVTPEEIARRSGLGRAAFYYVIRQALDKGFDTILLTLRLKGNLAHGLAARSGCVPKREYALYECSYE